MSSTYYLRTFWRVYAIGLFVLTVVMAAPFVWLGAQVFQDQPLSRAAMYVFALLLILLGAGLSVAAQRVRLDVSSDGLVFHGIGFQAHAPWDQVAGLDAQPGCSGLFVPNPTVTVDGWLSALLRLSQPIFWINLLLGRYHPIPDISRYARCIPVRAFASDWSNSPLAQDIAHYVPPPPSNLDSRS